jgi:hypothetical protein
MPDDKIGVIGYCCLVVRFTFRHAISRASFVIAIISIITGAVPWLAPSFSMIIEASGLEAMLHSSKFYAAVVALIIILNLICAQYRIWTEERAARTRAETQVAEMLARYAQLSVGPPYSVQDSSSGAVSWRIKVHNEGASATNVQMNLCNIPQRPKSQFWSHDFPYRIIQVGCTLNSNECHIHRGCDAIFELTKVWPAAHNSGFITTLDTNPGSHQVKIELGERLEMRYAVTAENTDGLEFILIMHAGSGGIAFVRHVASINESSQ